MAEFHVEKQQLESGRWIQVLVYARKGQPYHVVIGTVDDERTATTMSFSVENAITRIAGEAEDLSHVV